MTAFSRIDMAEVTRLTRAGRLTEATALLQGRAIPQDGRSAAANEAPRPHLDMVPPSRAGGAWTAPKAGAEPPGPGATPRGEPMRAMPAFGEDLGSPRRAPVPVPEGGRFEERTFAGEAGRRAYKVYVPSGCTGQALPVVLMLHGCTQSPDDFAAGTRMNEVAEERTFLVAYPAQSRAANAQRCWNWFNPADQRRDGGEPALLAGIARAVLDEFGADPSRVYVAGLSAGGAAASVLATTHPDLFAAVGVHSGLPCGSARDVPSAFAAMRDGGTLPPERTREPVPTIVFHGDADRTVNPINGDRIFERAASAAPAGEVLTRGATPAGMTYTRTVRSDASGRAMLEHWVLHGGGHAWSGGSPAGSYTEPRGPDASREMIRFFLAHRLANDPPRC